MKATIQRWRAQFLGDRHLHEFLWYCVPGVLAGAVVRAWLMAAMSYGYYHPDTHDFLTTIHRVITHGDFVVHNKTTFLTPVLYLLAFVPKLPALVIIPLGQHLRGLLFILMVGALCRLWFRYWRWFIVPLTLLAAIQPACLFWEHTLMSESGFVFCAVALALAGTVFVLRPARGTFLTLLAAMFLTAAARPEGNLLLGSGVLMTLLVYGARWRGHWKEIVMSVLLALFMLKITKTSHSGLLLYASLVHLTPDEPRSAPGIGPFIRPLRDEMRAQRAEAVNNDVVRTGKRIAAVLTAYAAANPDVDLGLEKEGKRKKKRKGKPVPPATSTPSIQSTPSIASPAGGGLPPDPADPPEADADENNPALDALNSGKNLSNLCRRLAIEAARKHPFELPGIAVRKFRTTITSDPGGVFTDYLFHEKHARSIVGKGGMMTVLGPGLVGEPIDTPERARAFVDAHYDIAKVGWFNRLESAWFGTINSAHLPASAYSPKFELPGVPVFYLLAVAGAVAALFRPARLRRFQWAFVATLSGMWFIVTVTGAVIPRHRFVLEPFWLLYLFFLFDSVVSLGAFLLGKRPPAVPSAADAPVPAAPPLP